MRFSLRVAGSLCCLLAIARLAAAGSERWVSLSEKVVLSDVIVFGRVTRQHTQVDATSGGLTTLSQVEVLDAIKGAQPGQQLTLYQVGGQLGDLHTWAVGAPRFSRGEQVILFANHFGSRLVLFSFGQGKIATKQRDGRRCVGPQPHTVELVGKPSAVRPRQQSCQPLEQFIAKLKTLTMP